ncbi:hypothetical protein [Aeromonas popoffii]|uniref:hypothetical protein n=1 Tax=Aeromonas popoffii TaxID=70856 RepID=UPI0012ECBD25|nr:hypothetical protein [Aeromonas popoffii]
MTGDNTELERQYRKNLMLVSMIVLIYSIAGGSFDKDITFSGAKLTFSRPHWIEMFMIVVMIFLQWRHWLVSGEIRRHHRSEVLNGLFLASNKIRYMIYVFNPGVTFKGVDDNGFAIVKYGERIGRIKIEIIDVFFTFILIKMTCSSKWLDGDELSVHGLTKDSCRGYGTPHILTNRELSAVRSRLNSDGYGLISVRYKRIIPFVILNVSYRARWIFLSYREVWFGDSLLPAFVTGSALISFFLSKMIG